MIIGLGVTVKVGLLTRQFSLHQGIGVSVSVQVC